MMNCFERWPWMRWIPHFYYSHDLISAPAGIRWKILGYGTRKWIPASSTIEKWVVEHWLTISTMHTSQAACTQTSEALPLCTWTRIELLSFFSLSSLITYQPTLHSCAFSFLTFIYSSSDCSVSWVSWPLSFFVKGLAKRVLLGCLIPLCAQWESRNLGKAFLPGPVHEYE